jgi:hypothetical protein
LPVSSTHKFISPELLLVLASSAFSLVLWFIADFFVISHYVEEREKRWETNRAGYVLYDSGWYTLAQNAHIPLMWGSATYPLCTDSDGFRIDCRVTASLKPADILFLGDSFTFGINGRWDETFVGIFEQKTRRSIINAGVSSYSPTPYVWQYKHALSTGRLLAHHTVIVGLDISDVQDEAAVWADGPSHPVKQPTYLGLREKNQAEQAKPHSALSNFFASNFAGTRLLRDQIVSVIAETMDRHAQPTDYTFNQIRSAFTWRKWSEIENGLPETVGIPKRWEFLQSLGYRPLGIQGGIDKVREKLRSISIIAQNRGGSVWILIYPWPAQLRYPSTIFDWEEFAKELCKEIRCKGVINTFPAFHAQVDWYDRVYVLGDVHFNTLGNRVVADQIIAALQE